LKKEYGKTWVAACQIAEWRSRNATGEDRIFELGTLAELHLLSTVYAEEADQKLAKKEIIRCCTEILQLANSDAFPLLSTRRQFKRYFNFWNNTAWEGYAEEALRALGENIAKGP